MLASSPSLWPQINAASPADGPPLKEITEKHSAIIASPAELTQLHSALPEPPSAVSSDDGAAARAALEADAKARLLSRRDSAAVAAFSLKLGMLAPPPVARYAPPQVTAGTWAVHMPADDPRAGKPLGSPTPQAAEPPTAPTPKAEAPAAETKSEPKLLEWQQQALTTEAGAVPEEEDNLLKKFFSLPFFARLWVAAADEAAAPAAAPAAAN